MKFLETDEGGRHADRSAGCENECVIIVKYKIDRVWDAINGIGRR